MARSVHFAEALRENGLIDSWRAENLNDPVSRLAGVIFLHPCSRGRPQSNVTPPRRGCVPGAPDFTKYVGLTY